MDYLKQLLSKIKQRWLSMNKRQKTYFAIAVVITTILMWAFITAGVITANFNRGMVKNSGDKQELQVSSMILTETKDGEKFWEIFGESGKYSSDHKVANLTNIVGNFYKDNSVEMSFESTHGLYNEETQQIILYDNVFVVLKDDISLIADKLIYDIKTKNINIEGNVKINKKQDFYASAQKAVIDSEYSHFRIIGSACSKLYK